MSTDENKIESLVSTGSDITGAAAGGIVGFLIGGPAGAAIGGPLGILIRRSLSDMANRALSAREKTRVGATAWYAIKKVKERLNSGDKLRDDGFFKAKRRERAGAEEIFEGVLLKAKNEHEEKKTRIIGNIFANTAFFPGFSLGEANHVLHIAENLTYRQICILSLIKRKNRLGIKLRRDSYSDITGREKKYETPSYETISSLQETFEMYSLGLTVCRDESDKSGESFWSMTEWNDIAPNGLELTIMGERYYQIMGLNDIPEEDVRDVAKHLSDFA